MEILSNRIIFIHFTCEWLSGSSAACRKRRRAASDSEVPEGDSSDAVHVSSAIAQPSRLWHMFFGLAELTRGSRYNTPGSAAAHRPQCPAIIRSLKMILQMPNDFTAADGRAYHYIAGVNHRRCHGLSYSTTNPDPYGPATFPWLYWSSKQGTT
jgi:hypothetical protein